MKVRIPRELTRKGNRSERRDRERILKYKAHYDLYLSSFVTRTVYNPLVCGLVWPSVHSPIQFTPSMSLFSVLLYACLLSLFSTALPCSCLMVRHVSFRTSLTPRQPNFYGSLHDPTKDILLVSLNSINKLPSTFALCGNSQFSILGHHDSQRHREIGVSRMQRET